MIWFFIFFITYQSPNRSEQQPQSIAVRWNQYKENHCSKHNHETANSRESVSLFALSPSSYFIEICAHERLKQQRSANAISKCEMSRRNGTTINHLIMVNGLQIFPLRVALRRPLRPAIKKYIHISQIDTSEGEKKAETILTIYISAHSKPRTLP